MKDENLDRCDVVGDAGQLYPHPYTARHSPPTPSVLPSPTATRRASAGPPASSHLQFWATPFPSLDLEGSAHAAELRRIAADYPRYESSTSAQPLARLIDCKILEKTCIWRELNYIGERGILPHDESSGDPVQVHPPAGTHGAYVALIEEQADIIFTARAPSEDEFALAEAAGVTLDVRPVARDAFVFIANVANPVESLPLETYRGVYTGEVTAWPGTGTPLRPYRRNPNSGSQELMEALVKRGEPMIEAPDMDIMSLVSMFGPIHAIAEEPAGLAYSVYFYALHMRPHPDVKLLGVDGVLPNRESIAEGSYPLATEVYVVVRAETAPDDPALLLREWLLTEEGQGVVAESGYVPLR